MTGRLIVLLALSGAACTAPPTDARRYQLTGVVAGRESASRLVVAHEAIEGLMPAMRMPFEIDDASTVRDGDRIVATLALTQNRSWLENVRVTGRGGVAEDSRGATRAAAGAVLPDLRLIDQDGTPRTLRDPAGRVLVVTFLYTRCPMPEMCPLMVRHLEALRQRVNDAGLGRHLALIGVTLDPAVDTPIVLRAYGEAVLKGTDRFDQWTLATGSQAQVEAAARFFGVGSRADRGFILHTLATAVVNAAGRVVRVFDSNSWRPDDLFDVVRGALENTATH